MPQFELEGVGDRRHSGLYRGLDVVDAIRRALNLDESVAVDVTEPAGAAAWQDVTIGGRPAGRVRSHQRMRFRRD